MAITLLRTGILYLTIIFTMRFLGKRQLGQLAPSELVVSVMISDLASLPLQDPGTPLLYGLIPVLVIASMEILLSGAVIRSIRFRTFLCGNPSFLIVNGEIEQGELRRNRITPDELLSELRNNGITEIASVKYAVLETDGSLSIIRKKADCPPSASDLSLSVTEAGYPTLLINDGQILQKNLTLLGFDERWLQKRLTENHVASVKDVFLLSSDKNGKLFFARKERP